MKRLFVALDLPNDIRCRLQLMAGGISGAKWVTPEKFHITLRFIGEVNEGRFQDAALALSEVDCPPFSLSLSGVDWFGDAKKPRVLYAKVKADHGLHTLRDRINTTLGALGFTPDNRTKFTPHVTLAYLRGLSCHDVMSYVQGHNLFQTDPFLVQQFCLYSSRMKRGGSQYTVESVYDLGHSDPFGTHPLNVDTSTDSLNADNFCEEDLIAEWMATDRSHSKTKRNQSESDSTLTAFPF